MKWLITLAATATLASCASNPTFSGQSVSDAILRKDIYSNVRLWFQAANRGKCSKVDNVVMSITSIKQSPSGALQNAHEVWRLTGCGISNTFDVTLIPDAKGETDMVISKRKDAP